MVVKARAEVATAVVVVVEAAAAEVAAQVAAAQEAVIAELANMAAVRAATEEVVTSEVLRRVAGLEVAVVAGRPAALRVVEPAAVEREGAVAAMVAARVEVETASSDRQRSQTLGIAYRGLPLLG